MHAPSQAEAAYVTRPVNPDRLAALKRHAGRSVLDVGCGNGAYADALPEREVFGIDRLRFPTWEGNIGRFVVSDAAALPFTDNSFDTIACFETLEHLPDPVKALKDYHRVTRENLIVTVPNCVVSPGQRASGVIYHHWIDPTHRNFWTLDEMTNLVSEHGFSVQESRAINHVSLSHLVLEAYGTRASTRLALRGLLKLAKQRPYGMTSLVVATKV